MLTVLIPIIVADIVVLATFLMLPVVRREKAFFGVRVSPEVYAGTGRQIVYRYWLTIVAIFAGLGAIGFFTALTRSNFIYAIAAYLASIPAGVTAYALFAREVRPFRVISAAARFATPLHTRRLSEYTNRLAEVVIAVLTIAPFFILIHYYSDLPARIPAHWNFRGEPDRWVRKGISTVFFLPVLLAYLQGWLLLMKYDLVHAKLTLPADNAEVFLRYKERSHVAVMKLMDWMRRLSAVLLFGVSLFVVLTTIEPFPRYMPVASAGVFGGVALMVTIGFYLTYRLVSISREMESVTGQFNVRRAAEEERWAGGGLFYYNPDDPALMVEKVDGFGFTYNFAGPGIALRLLFLAAIPLIVIWALWEA